MGKEILRKSTKILIANEKLDELSHIKDEEHKILTLLNKVYFIILVRVHI